MATKIVKSIKSKGIRLSWMEPERKMLYHCKNSEQALSLYERLKIPRPKVTIVSQMNTFNRLTPERHPKLGKRVYYPNSKIIEMYANSPDFKKMINSHTTKVRNHRMVEDKIGDTMRLIENGDKSITRRIAEQEEQVELKGHEILIGDQIIPLNSNQMDAILELLMEVKAISFSQLKTILNS